MSAEKYKLIVVDDEPDIDLIFRLMLTDLIDDNAFEYNFFISGEKCLEYLGKQDHLDTTFLVLSDINMPDMDGFALLENIKSAYEELSVVMVSAYSDDRYIQRAKDLGAQDYFVKPIDFNVLRVKLVEFFENSEKDSAAE